MNRFFNVKMMLMKQDRTFPYIRVTKKQENRIKNGHPWVYADEITEQTETIENGAFTDVFGQKGNYLGTGFYSERSKIRVRILGANANEKYDDAFFARKVRYAIQYRLDVMKDDFSACRIIHGEADGLPGLTVDRYESILVSLSSITDRTSDVRAAYSLDTLAETEKEDK